MKEWISVKDQLPPVKWSGPDEEGKRYFDTVPVLLLRKITCSNGETFNSIAVGEHDTGGIPERWVICYYTNTKEDGLDFVDVEINDVTHWMPLPDKPKRRGFMLFTKEFLDELKKKPGALEKLDYYTKIEGMKFPDAVLKIADINKMEPQFIEQKKPKPDALSAYIYIISHDEHIINLLKWIDSLEALADHIRASERDDETVEELSNITARWTNEIGVRMLGIFSEIDSLQHKQAYQTSKN